MEEIFRSIADHGVLIVIAVVFIWDKISSAKTIANILLELQSNVKIQTGILEGLKQTGENTATALNIIQNTLAVHTQLLTSNAQSFERHDKRAEYMSSDIRSVITVLEQKPCILHKDRDH